MRRISTILLSVAAALVALPIPAAGAVDCAVSTLPVLPGTRSGGGAAILDANTILGWVSEPHQGAIWRNGSVSKLDIVASEVNPSGQVAGYVPSGQYTRAARMRLGGTLETIPTQLSGLHDVNAAGDAVGYQMNSPVPPIDFDPLWWKRDEAAPRGLPGPPQTSTIAIDDLGNIIGWGETSGARRYLIWGPDGTIKREYPYTTGQTRVVLKDIENGIVVADRYPPSGDPEIVRINVATGTITPVAGTHGWRAEEVSNGSILAEASDDYRVLHNGTTYTLPAPTGTDPGRVADMNVFGSTAVVTGLSFKWDGSTTLRVPTVWRCG